MTDSYEILDFPLIEKFMRGIDWTLFYYNVGVVESYPEYPPPYPPYVQLASDITVVGAVATFTVVSGTSFYFGEMPDLYTMWPVGHCTLDAAATSFTVTVQRVT